MERINDSLLPSPIAGWLQPDQWEAASLDDFIDHRSQFPHPSKLKWFLQLVPPGYPAHEMIMVGFENVGLRKEGDIYVLSNAQHELKVAFPQDLEYYLKKGNKQSGSRLRIIIDYNVKKPDLPTTETCFLHYAQIKSGEIHFGGDKFA